MTVKGALFCIECHQLRNNFANHVVDKDGELIGFRCRKCAQKAFVSTGGETVGRGWRVRLREFVAQFVKNQKAKMAAVNAVK